MKRNPTHRTNATVRRDYTGSKRFDRTCRNHGSCGWCAGNRAHKSKRQAPAPDTDIDPLPRCEGCHEIGHDLSTCPTHWQDMVTGNIYAYADNRDRWDDDDYDLLTCLKCNRVLPDYSFLRSDICNDCEDDWRLYRG